jgi:Na+/proline symporter
MGSIFARLQVPVFFWYISWMDCWTWCFWNIFLIMPHPHIINIIRLGKKKNSLYFYICVCFCFCFCFCICFWWTSNKQQEDPTVWSYWCKQFGKYEVAFFFFFFFFFLIKKKGGLFFQLNKECPLNIF